MPAGRETKGSIISLSDENNVAVSFCGEKIAEASSRTETGKSAQRWSEIAIYRDDTGTYVAQEIGRSAITGEVDRFRLHRGTPQGVYNALTRDGKRVTLLVEEALAQAADRDAQFARELGDVLDYEDVPLPAGISMLPAIETQRYVVDRDDGRPLRFTGVLLARGSSRVEEAERWTEFALYRLADGRLLGAKQQIDVAMSEARKSSVIFSPDVAGVVRAFAREGVGWVEGALIDAIAAAAARDRAVAEEVGPQVVPWAHAIVGSTRVQVNDARYRVLERMERGSLLLTQDEGSKVVVVGWNDGAEAPPKQVFLALSRQRLIRRSAPSSPAVAAYAWTISAKGRAVLAEARSGDRRQPVKSGL